MSFDETTGAITGTLHQMSGNIDDEFVSGYVLAVTFEAKDKVNYYASRSIGMLPAKRWTRSSNNISFCDVAKTTEAITVGIVERSTNKTVSWQRFNVTSLSFS